MNRETVAIYTMRRPFRPFVLHLADGQGLRVRHPDCLGIKETCLGVLSADGFKHVVALDQIVSIQYELDGARS